LRFDYFLSWLLAVFHRETVHQMAHRMMINALPG